MTPIGIFGGTFDPIHFGHLRAACEVQEALGLAELRFMPCGVPPHRPPPQASGAQRLAMVRAAVSGQRDFVVDDRELRRAGPSYMVDTLHSLRAEGQGTALCLILGSDAFLGLNSWSRWRELPELAHLVVIHRPGWSLDTSGLPQELAQALSGRIGADPQVLRHRQAGAVMLLAVPALDISSTRIRAAQQAGRTVRYLVPDSVLDIIRNQHIYE